MSSWVGVPGIHVRTEPHTDAIRRVRLPRCRRRPLSDSTLRKQLELQERLADPEGEYVEEPLYDAWHEHQILTGTTVCVSSLMVSEIKKIIKDSEILKYASPASSTTHDCITFDETNLHTERTTRNGRRRTRTGGKNSKSALGRSTSRSRRPR